MFEIKRTLKEKDINSNFVALGFLVYQGGTHASFIINYNSILYEFHFPKVIDFSIVKHDYFHKITNIINPRLVPFFYAMCRRIEKKAKPEYGYFYSGEYYDKAGVHFSKKPSRERMTCVGFCLNVLKGFLDEDYLQYQDWNSDSHEDPDYLINYAQKHNLNIEDLSESHRRITPIELLVSGYFTKLPIRKTDIDSKIGSVADYINKSLN